jgi:hypothetical protein
VLEDVARRIFDELSEGGYEPRLHEPDEEDGAFEIRLPAHGFELGDYKTLAKISEDFGVGLRFDSDGWLTVG